MGPPDVDDDPAVRERDDRRLPFKEHLAAEHVAVEAAGALDVLGNDEVGEGDSFGGRWNLDHR